MRNVNSIALGFLILTGCPSLKIAVADELHVQIHPESLGPFAPGEGGEIPYFVSVEIFDLEMDGYDSQGIGSIGWDLLTDTGVAQPYSEAALTGETGIYGSATSEMRRYEYTNGTTEMFVGGYGYGADFALFVGIPENDDLLGVGGYFPVFWEADVEPNVPGLQPEALAGIAIGERPAGGLWVLAEGSISIPTDPGTYAVELTPIAGYFILPGLDLSQDYVSYQGEYAPEALVGDSFSFVVLPEPGTFACVALGLLFCRRR